MRTDNTATALVFLLVLIVFIFVMSSLAQYEPEHPDTMPVYFGATYTATPMPTYTFEPAVETLLAGPTFHPSLPTLSVDETPIAPPLFAQAMTPTIRPVIIPRWP